MEGLELPPRPSGLEENTTDQRDCPHHPLPSATWKYDFNCTAILVLGDVLYAVTLWHNDFMLWHTVSQAE
jgi:hypothetical protein